MRKIFSGKKLIFAMLLAFLFVDNVYADWSIRFIPNEASSVSVNINNESFMTWNSAEGDSSYVLPAKWLTLQKIHVYAAASPKDKNATIQVIWNGKVCKEMKFDNDEDHDVSTCN